MVYMIIIMCAGAAMVETVADTCRPHTHLLRVRVCRRRRILVYRTTV
jgi:hypothetical protein